MQHEVALYGKICRHYLTTEFTLMQGENAQTEKSYVSMVLVEPSIKRIIDCSTDDTQKEYVTSVITGILIPPTDKIVDINLLINHINHLAGLNEKLGAYARALFFKYIPTTSVLDITPQQRSYAIKLNACLFGLYQISTFTETSQNMVVLSGLRELVLLDNWLEYLELSIYDIKLRLDTLGVEDQVVDNFYQSIYG